MTMPALRSLKKANPESKITLLVKPWVAPLFEKDPFVDEIILYTDQYKGLIGKFRLASHLKQYDFCSAVLFQNAFDAALITFLAGIPERIGYGRDFRGILLTEAVPFDSAARGLHHIGYYSNLLERAGYPVVQNKPWIYLLIDERLEARERLRRLKRPVVALNPGAAYGSSKRWRPERFAEVAVRVIHELQGSIVVLGGSSETGIATEIVEGIKKQNPAIGEILPAPPLIKGGRGDFSVHDSDKRRDLMNLAGKTSLRELSALIAECDALVTNDSGPMHVGYAVGTPMVAIFGSTSPEMTGPPSEGDVVIKKDLECSPCFERECRKGELQCMDRISSDEVFQSLQKLIATKRAVFFDRDGTLCKDAHYLNRMEDLEIFPETGNLKKLAEAGFLQIGVSNQSGIARGIVAEEFVKKVNAIFTDGYGFDGFYYCPHHPDEGCSCRKPEPGLLLRARKDFGINLKGSFMIGDKEIDMLLAKSVGAAGIHVKTGQEGFSSHADFTARDLNEAIDIILRTT
ncbi:MAG: HAD-IIIA family hydrolase [Nitrospirae bacterium]|nr:HAD-IIIA family hydrolase [Nitrospirota bacterium]